MSTTKDTNFQNKNDEQAEEKRRKSTDTDQINARGCEFKNNLKIIIDHPDENCNNYCTQICNVDNINKELNKMIKPNNDSLCGFATKTTNKRVGRQLVNVRFDDPLENSGDPIFGTAKKTNKKRHYRQLVNVGFENILWDSTNQNKSLSFTEKPSSSLNQEVTCSKVEIKNIVKKSTNRSERNLITIEKVFASADPKVSSSELPKDPFTNFSGERAKDNISDEVFSSTPCDVAGVVEGERENMNEPTPLLKSSNCPYCEYDQCNYTICSCYEQCLCVRCIKNFDCQAQMKTSEAHAYSTENAVSQMDNMAITESRCQYLNCTEEVFSTCGKCLCFLCYEHFSADDTYSNCAEHIFSMQ